MKNNKTNLLFLGAFLLCAPTLFAAEESMRKVQPGIVGDQLKSVQQKCQQNVQKIKDMITPSGSKREAIKDAAKRIIGKDKKGKADEDLNAFLMEHNRNDSRLVEEVTAYEKNAGHTIQEQDAMITKIREHGMACDQRTASIENSLK